MARPDISEIAERHAAAIEANGHTPVGKEHWYDMMVISKLLTYIEELEAAISEATQIPSGITADVALRHLFERNLHILKHIIRPNKAKPSDPPAE